MRTVTAVQDCEVFFLTRTEIHELYGTYPELQARMGRFAATGRVVDDDTLRSIDLKRNDLHEFSKEYKEHMEIAADVRKEKNLAGDSFVPEHLMQEHTFTVIRAVSKFKNLPSAKRLQARKEKRKAAAAMMEEGALEGKTPDAQLAMMSEGQVGHNNAPTSFVLV